MEREAGEWGEQKKCMEMATEAAKQNFSELVVCVSLSRKQKPEKISFFIQLRSLTLSLRFPFSLFLFLFHSFIFGLVVCLDSWRT